MKNSKLMFMMIAGFSLGLIAQDANDQQGPFSDDEGLTAVDIENVMTQITPSIYKESYNALVPVCKEITSNAIEATKQISGLLNDAVDAVGVKILQIPDNATELKEQFNKKTATIQSKYEAEKFAQDLNVQEITPVKKGNSWYFNTLEIFNLNSDDAKIEMAKVELGAEKVAAIEKKSMGADKANQAFLKLYNKMHPATFTDAQRLTGAGLFVTAAAACIAYTYFYGSEKTDDTEEDIDKN